mmetsp:Transcript_22383/g.57515  ORF Transcript_22383/g.57515 Transcript_22383/m.57515 type:complete len:208 (-) Transcript_22383:152-775(-)
MNSASADTKPWTRSSAGMRDGAPCALDRIVSSPVRSCAAVASMRSPTVGHHEPSFSTSAAPTLTVPPLTSLGRDTRDPRIKPKTAARASRWRTTLAAASAAITAHTPGAASAAAPTAAAVRAPRAARRAARRAVLLGVLVIRATAIVTLVLGASSSALSSDSSIWSSFCHCLSILSWKWRLRSAVSSVIIDCLSVVMWITYDNVCGL